MTTRHLCGWTRKTTPEKRRTFYSGTILRLVWQSLPVSKADIILVSIFTPKIQVLARNPIASLQTSLWKPFLSHLGWTVDDGSFTQNILSLKWENALNHIQFHHGEPRKKWYSLVMPSLPLQHSKWTQIFWLFWRKNINLCFKNKGILPPDKCSPQTGAQNLIWNGC